VVPDLQMAEHVHLQGWGEPLLHPDLRQMVRDCKTSGCSVGITTNGDLLEPAISWIADEAVDFVTVSVAGGPDTHAELRGGSRLEQILAVAGELVRVSSQKRRKIRVQLSYLLIRDNACHLPVLVEMAARARLKEVFVIHLDCTPSSDLLSKSAFDENGLVQGVKEHLDAAARMARKHAIRFRGPAMQPQELLACAIDPTRFAFVTAEGRVGPCVYSLLPLTGLIPRRSHAGEHQVEPEFYGQLQDAGLKEILEGPVRRSFVLPFDNRLKAERDFISSLSVELGVEALQELESAYQQRARTLSANPFPSVCSGCHKAYGW
jgi:MoaA/NifB/PqqE/SkfB family radical SAM enzyme